MAVVAAEERAARPRAHTWARRTAELADFQVPCVTETAVYFAAGLGGRVCDLPSYYLDAVAQANRRAHPKAFVRRAVVRVMYSPGYLRPTHRLVAGFETYDQFQAYARDVERRYRAEEYRRRRLRRREKFASAPHV